MRSHTPSVKLERVIVHKMLGCYSWKGSCDNTIFFCLSGWIKRNDRMERQNAYTSNHVRFSLLRPHCVNLNMKIISNARKCVFALYHTPRFSFTLFSSLSSAQEPSCRDFPCIGGEGSTQLFQQGARLLGHMEPD